MCCIEIDQQTDKGKKTVFVEYFNKDTLSVDPRFEQLILSKVKNYIQ